ncbi:guanylate kinase [Roseibacillus persicicus]|uniref:guanylate kinase n=1 Tax=Roseibacillus persicicus TaxID=454148 RepID=UPI00366B3A3A
MDSSIHIKTKVISKNPIQLRHLGPKQNAPPGNSFDSMTSSGILYLVSGPSGSGKTTLCRRLALEGLAHYSTSCTTRTPREGEVNGRDYYFLTVPEFQEEIANEAFLEHAEVHGNFYGTLLSEVLTFLDQGKDVVMDIDVQGAEQVRLHPNEKIQQALLDLFVMPATDEELELRLRGRGTDPEDVIALRLKNAREEVEHWPKYSYRLLSTDKESDYTLFKNLLLTQRLHTSRQKD